MLDSQLKYIVYHAESENITCHDGYKIEHLVSVTDVECERRCNELDECKFFFFPGTWCNLYSSCEKCRASTFDGITYKKPQKGGILFQFIVTYIRILIYNIIRLITLYSYKINIKIFVRYFYRCMDAK